MINPSLGKKAITFIVLSAFLAGLLPSCAPSFRMNSTAIDAFFNLKKVEAKQYSYAVGGREIHYVQSGNEAKPLVLFIHGSPGSLTAFIDFLADSSLLEKALLISTDRPGFGYSNFGMAEPSLAKQAADLKPILEKYKGNRPAILVGHSLAGPLIAKMAMDYPDRVDGLVIVAGAIDPELEPDEAWFRGPLSTPFLSWILPRAFRASNEEIYHLKPQLETMIPYWKNIRCPVIVIQGRKDRYVPYENVNFAKKMLVNAPLKLMIVDDMDHFVPWSHPFLIRQAITEMLGAKDSLKNGPEVRLTE